MTTTPRYLLRVAVIGALMFPYSTEVSAQTRTGPDSNAVRIAKVFAPFDRSDAPGCAVGVYRAGTVLYSGGFGMADIAHHLRLTDTTAMFLASTSKQFTAFAVLLLEAEGKLRLTDDIRRYVPELHDFGRTITIRELLNHTSGLRDQWNLFDMAGWRTSDVETQSDLLWLIGRQRALNHLPGAEFLYNNTGFSLLAVVVERVSGTTFRNFISERIFAPLGMLRSDTKTDIGQVVSGLATGYWSHDPASLRVARPPYSFAGPTGIISTVRDLARWDANAYSPRIGNRALLDAMSTHGQLADGTPIGYGMGLSIGTHRGRRMLSHAGSDPGYRSDLIRFPQDSLTVAVLCNAFDIAPTPLALSVADLFLPATNDSASASSLPSLPAIALTRGAIAGPSAEKLAGLYWNNTAGGTHRFFFEHDGLVLDAGGEGRFPLSPLGNGAYRLLAAPRRYVFTFLLRLGAPIAVEENIEGSPIRVYARVPEAARAALPLKSLAGAYYSPEVDMTWTFVMRGQKLVLERHRREPDPLTRLFGDVFQSENGFVLEFSRDRKGEAQGVEVTTERVRRLRFRRPGK